MKTDTLGGLVQTVFHQQMLNDFLAGDPLLEQIRKEGATRPRPSRWQILKSRRISYRVNKFRDAWLVLTGKAYISEY